MATGSLFSWLTASHPFSARTFPLYTHIFHVSNTLYFANWLPPKSQVSNLWVGKIFRVYCSSLSVCCNFHCWLPFWVSFQRQTENLYNSLLSLWNCSMHLVLLVAKAQLYRDEMHRTITCKSLQLSVDTWVEVGVNIKNGSTEALKINELEKLSPPKGSKLDFLVLSR